MGARQSWLLLEGPGQPFMVHSHHLSLLLTSILSDQERPTWAKYVFLEMVLINDQESVVDSDGEASIE